MKLGAERIQELLRPYLCEEPPTALAEKVSTYLDLLAHWSKRVSLTSLREPEQVVQRHFGESFFLAERLPKFSTLLDLGSGAGFPGVPIALLYPKCAVTLAESQQKKAAFLREACWMLGITSKVSVWAARMEQAPAERTFDVVTLRAVDAMQEAVDAGAARVATGGTLAFFAGASVSARLPDRDWTKVVTHDLPQSTGRILIATTA